MMIHGTIPDIFKKIINEEAPEHFGEVFLQLANIMGPANDNESINKDIPAGWTYFGQFVDHDLTFEREFGMNSRTPIFDLDSLYGQGPNSTKHNHLFEGNEGHETFKIGSLGTPQNKTGDLFRDENFVAQIPDPRNDENIIIASLQLLFQKFHNLLITNHGFNFNQAKQAVVWHYQSIVRTDFLPRIVGSTKIEEIKQNGLKVFNPTQISEVFMPTEYSGACFRFGHSMVRERYSFNSNFNDFRSFPALFFDFPNGRPIEGGHQITIPWTLQGNGESLLRFFDPTILDPLRDANNLSGSINTQLSKILFNLEIERGQNNILAHRNLITGQQLKLANGQQVAAFLRNADVTVTELTSTEILSGGAPLAIQSNTPLWYYVLKEAELQHNGKHLGDVGGTIVAETIIGLLNADPLSVVNRTDDWPIKLGNPDNNDVTMIDIINFVDVG